MTTHARFRSGKGGNIAVGGVLLANHQYHTQDKFAISDVTNFESNGFYEGVAGISSAAWSTKADWDSTLPQSGTPGLYPRDDGPGLSFTSVGGTVVMDLPEFICVDATIDCDTKGMVTFDANGTNQGTFTT